MQHARNQALAKPSWLSDTTARAMFRFLFNYSTHQMMPDTLQCDGTCWLCFTRITTGIKPDLQNSRLSTHTAKCTVNSNSANVIAACSSSHPLWPESMVLPYGCKPYLSQNIHSLDDQPPGRRTGKLQTAHRSST